MALFAWSSANIGGAERPDRTDPAAEHCGVTILRVAACRVHRRVLVCSTQGLSREPHPAQRSSPRRPATCVVQIQPSTGAASDCSRTNALWPRCSHAETVVIDSDLSRYTSVDARSAGTGTCGIRGRRRVSGITGKCSNKLPPRRVCPGRSRPACSVFLSHPATPLAKAMTISVLQVRTPSGPGAPRDASLRRTPSTVGGSAGFLPPLLRAGRSAP